MIFLVILTIKVFFYIVKSFCPLRTYPQSKKNIKLSFDIPRVVEQPKTNPTNKPITSAPYEPTHSPSLSKKLKKKQKKNKKKYGSSHPHLPLCRLRYSA